jgi:hypothetical protein
MVYGEGQGFGNRTSIQDVTIVQAAKALRRVYKVDNDDPVCHSSFEMALKLTGARYGPFATSSTPQASTCRFCDGLSKARISDTVTVVSI